MNILLTAINAKYIHSNLAVYSLKAAAGKYAERVELAEYTINHQEEEIFRQVYQKKPDLLFLSCYIWNRCEVLALAENIHKVLPDTVIWAGGPEVSYDAPAFLEENPAFTGVMIGEGEETFGKLLAYYLDGRGKLAEIPGIAYRMEATTAEGCGSDTEDGVPEEDRTACVDTAKLQREGNGRNCPCEICRNTPVRLSENLDGLPFVYGDLDRFENRIIYYETSRGCPFSCSYCLSSIDKKVRFRSLEQVFGELEFFLEHRVPQVKFVDRTFNCSHSHAMAIWKYIQEHDNGVTNFHFEIAADLLNEEELQLLGTMRPGLVQLEIGVQTVNEQALEAIHRTAKFEKIVDRVKRVSSYGNIHQHLDLIAGLPYEDFASFRESFDKVYALHPQELQLGFLKVLRGSEMHCRAEEYGIIYRSRPPYEVLATKWITCDELLRLKEVEEMLEVYYNSQQFRNTMSALEQKFDGPFALYSALADYYKKEQLEGKSHSRMQRFEILRDFILEQGFEKTYFEELLTLDLYLRENAKSRPGWAADLSPYQKAVIQFYQREEQEHRYLPEYSQMTWKQIMRMTHMERFTGEHGYSLCNRTAGDPGCFLDDKKQPERWLLFDYRQRDPLTGDGRTLQVEL